MNTTTKQCSKCKNLKPLVDFHNSKIEKHGKRHICKGCVKDYYQKNKKRISENQKERLFQVRLQRYTS